MRRTRDLARWARRPSSPQSLALRSKVVLACAEGKPNLVEASELACSPATVGKWRSRFVLKRLKGLADEHRPGVPRSVTDDDVEAVVVKTLERKTARRHPLVDTGAGQVLGHVPADGEPDLEGVRPQTMAGGTFKLSEDPLFVDKVRDIVGLYMGPPERAVVICVDEKTAVQTLDRTQPVLPLLPHVPKRRSHDYKRYGTIDLFAALNLTSGMVIHRLPPATGPSSSKTSLTS